MEVLDFLDEFPPDEATDTVTSSVKGVCSGRMSGSISLRYDMTRESAWDRTSVVADMYATGVLPSLSTVVT